MKINLSSLKENLPESPSFMQKFTPGLFRAIEFCHDTHWSGDVDWNSFSVDDAVTALGWALVYEGSESVDDLPAGERPNEGNPIQELLHSREAILALKRLKPEMNSEGVEFF